MGVLSSLSSLASVSSVPSPSPSASVPAGLAVSVPLGRGAKAAREFEAQLIASLMESMQKTFATLPGEASSAEADNYSFLGTHALAELIADRGGFGIAAMIASHLPAHEGKG